MAPRWKGKSAEAKALSEPMSGIVFELQSSFVESNSVGQLAGNSVLVAANRKQTELLNRSCFGHPIATADEGSQWFQLTLNEALYMRYVLRCIEIAAGEDMARLTDEELWEHAVAADLSLRFEGYAYLRAKNWVVRDGSQYGVDFVAYRHHPSLVHSEFAVLVLPSSSSGDRLRSWSDFHCTVRLCGSVAKTLLMVCVGRRRDTGDGGGVPPWSLERYRIEERVVTRWNPQQCRD
ncbi:hypothetical protein M569_17530, partial [Genlisea aurea]